MSAKPNIEKAIEQVRSSRLVKMNTTVGELLDQLREQEKSGNLEAAKLKNGGVLVTKCFAFVTACE